MDFYTSGKIDQLSYVKTGDFFLDNSIDEVVFLH